MRQDFQESQERRVNQERTELMVNQESPEKMVLLVSRVHEDHEVLLGLKDQLAHKV